MPRHPGNWPYTKGIGIAYSGLVAKKPAKSRSKGADDSPLAAAAAEAARAASPQHPIPVPFTAILGQDRAIKVLGDAVRSERVHHAWIFHGPAGVGKFTTALAFAATILDPTAKVGKDGVPTVDDESEVQRLLRAGTHPDLHIITKELARYSEDAQVRDRKLITIPKDVIDTHLLEPAALAPAMPGGRASKVFIIDEAELLDRSPTNAPTQNAILKTLEEPPAGTVIILVTTNPDRLLTTIRSRSQQVAFVPLMEGPMRVWLDQAKKAIDPPIEEDDLGFLHSFAAGSPGEFQRAHAGGLANWSRTLEPMLAAADAGKYSVELGPTMAKLVDDWAAAVVEKDKQASKDAANRTGADLLFRVISERSRRQIRRTPTDAERSIRVIESVREAERAIDAGVNMNFAMEWLSSRVSGKPGAGLVAAN
jgi:DNA polymerase-3 subunit delta'